MRVKKGTKGVAKRNRILKATKGFRGSNSTLLMTARTMLHRAMAYAHRDRRNRKREFRSLWIIRINAAARSNGLSYNNFIYGLKRAGVELDRKTLAQTAFEEPAVFSQLAEVAKQHLN